MSSSAITQQHATFHFRIRTHLAPTKSNSNLINIWKYLLRSNESVRLPLVSPCDVWGVTQWYSRGGDSMCWNGWWQSFHPTHRGLFVVIFGSLMGAIWESRQETGSHHCLGMHTHTQMHTNRHLHIQSHHVSLSCQSYYRIFFWENPLIVGN